ncbi:MAG: ArsR family transcriptional regulator [Nitrososphaeraceae archaeon]
MSNSHNNKLSSYNRTIVRSSIDPRDKIHDLIAENPGVRYKELTRLAATSNGVLTYHLRVLEKLILIRVERQSNNRVTRYFVDDIPKGDSEIIGYFRNGVTRKIILFLLKKKICTFSEIVDDIEKAPSTVSWHIKRLKEVGILQIIHGEERLYLYRLMDRRIVTQILLKYEQSFADKIVDNYTEMIDKL